MGAPNSAIMPSPEHLVDGALEAVHGVHHELQGRIEELLGGFGIEVADQLGGAFEVGKQHRHLLALAFQGTAGRQDLLGEIGRGVGEGRLARGLHGRRGGDGSGASLARPDQAAPRIVADLWMGIEECVLEIGESLLV